ncbi:MAG: hypothetical protein Kow0069_15940 [Promethearchaeota archaeon]
MGQIVHADLHYHSGASGSVGRINLLDFVLVAPLKGINVVGTGDCLHDRPNKASPVPWVTKLQDQLVESGDGSGAFYLRAPHASASDDGDELASLPRSEVNGVEVYDSIVFVLQSEVIFTCAIENQRKMTHVVLLFPSFEAVDDALSLFRSWGSPTHVGRPFVSCDDPEDVGDKLNRLLDLNPLVEAVPAHVMTPSGVFGSKVPVDWLENFFGGATSRIHAVETGLSADPVVLGLIPELDDLTLLSCSDAHSVHPHRLGREFTTLEVDSLDYAGIVDAIRNKRVVRTAEFNPAEGKYFLSGHRADKAGHERGAYCVFSPKHTPPSKLCPICGKPVTVGVLERATHLSWVQTGGDPREFGYRPPGQQEFVHVVPLVEVLSRGYFGSKAPATTRGLRLYQRLVPLFGNECQLWLMSEEEVLDAVRGKLGDAKEVKDEGKLLNLLMQVKRGEFCYRPMGFDGQYGQLCFGEAQAPEDAFETNVVVYADHLLEE